MQFPLCTILCSIVHHCAPYCAVVCSPGALHHPLSNHIKSASNWVRTLLSSSLDISIVYLYLYEIPHGYIDIAHIWKRSDVFALEVDLLPADRRDSFGKFLISKWTEETSNALWGQNLNADLIAGRIWGGNRDQRLPATFTHGGHPPRIGIFVEIGFLSASQQYLCFLFLGICQFSICIPCPHRCFGLPGGAADVRCPHFGIWEGRTLLFVSSTYFRTLLQLWFLFHF